MPLLTRIVLAVTYVPFVTSTSEAFVPTTSAASTADWMFVAALAHVSYGKVAVPFVATYTVDGAT